MLARPEPPIGSVSNARLWSLLLLSFLLVNEALWMEPLNSMKGRGCADLPIKSLGQKPILQIELSRNESDLAAVFLEGNVKSNVHDVRTGTALDTFLFIPTYSALLLAIGVLVAKGRTRSRLFWATAAAVAVIALADWCENAGIERALDHIEASQAPQAGDAEHISYPSILKWTLLGLLLVGLGGAAIRHAPAGMRVLAVVLIVVGCKVLYQMTMYFQERFGAPM